jgi:hypothetical protein
MVTKPGLSRIVRVKNPVALVLSCRQAYVECAHFALERVVFMDIREAERRIDPALMLQLEAVRRRWGACSSQAREGDRKATALRSHGSRGAKGRCRSAYGQH